MKKILTVAAFAALTAGSSAAIAADMPIRKAPPPPPVVSSWTACYVGAGGGYGMWNQDATFETFPGLVALGTTFTAGGRGWFGTVQVGCDYQVSSNWVIGAFADYDFGRIKGTLGIPGVPLQGEERQSSAWSAGGRIGYLPFERLMVFVSAGYTSARFDDITVFTTAVPPVATGTALRGNTYDGFFIGSGYEYVLGWFPGLTWKTEYRFADYRGDDLARYTIATGVNVGDGIHSRKYEQTIRSELVWRWGGGPVRAAY
jgi:outer membrane immunogenic protein